MLSAQSRILLVLSLLFGLWLSAAHSAEHTNALAGHESCAVCVFGNGLGSGLQAASQSLLLPKHCSPEEALQPAPVFTRVCHRQQPRGPPLSHV